MKNKIQPSQYDPYQFSTPSGNIIIESGVNLFNFYIPTVLTGDFSVTGSFSVNGLNAIYPADSNIVSGFENGNRVFAGSNNAVYGINDIIIGGINNVASGENLLCYGQGNSVEGVQNSIAFGKNIAIEHNDSVVFGDFTSSFKGSTTTGSITFDYAGGFYVNKDTYLLGTSYFNNNLYVTGDISADNMLLSNNLTIQNDLFVTGEFNVFGSSSLGDLAITGHSTISGSRVQTQSDITGFSGYANSTFLSKAEMQSYTGSTIGLQSVMVTGNQSITGTKTFQSVPSFQKGISLPTGDATRFVPKLSNANGSAGAIAFSGDYLYIATGTNLWGRVQLSTW